MRVTVFPKKLRTDLVFVTPGNGRYKQHEYTILQLVLEGKTREEIRHALGVKTRRGGKDTLAHSSSISYTLRRIYDALGIKNDIELALLCYERGIVTFEE
jgi:DNA-binding NarL/FixJ family response regulator